MRRPLLFNTWGSWLLLSGRGLRLRWNRGRRGGRRPILWRVRYQRRLIDRFLRRCRVRGRLAHTLAREESHREEDPKQNHADSENAEKLTISQHEFKFTFRADCHRDF